MHRLILFQQVGHNIDIIIRYYSEVHQQQILLLTATVQWWQLIKRYSPRTHSAVMTIN